MTAKVLIVDDVPANLKLLKAKLEADYYEVLCALDGESAIEIARSEAPDIILLDVMMPGLSGFDVTQRLKHDPDTHHIPIILVTALDGRDDRLKGLSAGADDFLTKPIDDVLLMARLKSLVRFKQRIDDSFAREKASRQSGLLSGDDVYRELRERALSAMGNVLIVDDQEASALRLMNRIARDHRCAFEPDMDNALKIASGRVDLIVLNLMVGTFDALRFIARLRSVDQTRSKAILGILPVSERQKMLKALELGVNDVVFKPIDADEIRARVATQIRRKRFEDYLAQSLDRSLEIAVTDGLTGLNNRRFMDHHLGLLMEKAKNGQSTLSVLLFDIDHFKAVNDTIGHDGGDEVLKEFSRRLHHNVRAIDLPCRMGGEEFVVLMPETDSEHALMIAERVRERVESEPFMVGQDKKLSITVSVGVATSVPHIDRADLILKRADDGVYAAKKQGRNRVILKVA